MSPRQTRLPSSQLEVSVPGGQKSPIWELGGGFVLGDIFLPIWELQVDSKSRGFISPLSTLYCPDH